MSTPPAPDLRQRLAQAQAQAPPAPGQTPVTSDLSIDEALMLHSVHWEPLALVCGVSVQSVPSLAWRWGSGAITAAESAHTDAMAAAAARIEGECQAAGGVGVVGVSVRIAIHPNHIDVELVGTAVRPSGALKRPARPFLSDLRARDFALLTRAGWVPTGLAFGAGFVYAPRRAAGAALRQTGQNVELENLTQALYAARESAMERMQSSAVVLGGHGVVAVTITEGPMSFAPHAIGFTTWGTAVRVLEGGHRPVQPQVAVMLDDPTEAFAASSLRS